MTFSSLGLCKPIVKVLNEKGYSSPYPIQQKAIPAVLSGKDVMAAAQTGTGKTASFALPIIQNLSSQPKLKIKKNYIRALILTPTRELAIQVGESVLTYGKYLSLKSFVVYGGVAINPQMMKLRGGVDILVATPGRLIDLHSKNSVDLSQVETLVLDEADRMLDLGFSEDINKILSFVPHKRQNLLFSATFSNHIRKLADGFLKKPLKIEVSTRNSTAKKIKQIVYEVDKSKKTALLSHLVLNNVWNQILVFTRTKKGANRLVNQLVRNKIVAEAIHGDKSQSQRNETLSKFKENKIHVLAATDLASRGIDIIELPCVINFDLPKVSEDYIHRIGRTGRAGSEGLAISLVSADEVRLLSGIENCIRKVLVREVIEGFVPVHSVPLTLLSKVKTKKPKKNKKLSVRSEVENAPSNAQKEAKLTRRGRGAKNEDQNNVKSGGRRNRSRKPKKI